MRSSTGCSKWSKPHREGWGLELVSAYFQELPPSSSPCTPLPLVSTISAAQPPTPGIRSVRRARSRQSGRVRFIAVNTSAPSMSGKVRSRDNQPVRRVRMGLQARGPRVGCRHRIPGGTQQHSPNCNAHRVVVYKKNHRSSRWVRTSCSTSERRSSAALMRLSTSVLGTMTDALTISDSSIAPNRGVGRVSP